MPERCDMTDTSPQLPLFDAPPSRAAVKAHFDRRRAAMRRDEGVQLTVTNNRTFLARMRQYAKAMAMRRGSVHIDDVRKHALELGIQPESSSAWGAIFRERGWRQTGEFRASTFVSNHGHRSPVWRWAG